MVKRSILKCTACDKAFVFRIAVGCSYTHKFRFNCPFCGIEMHGVITVNFRNPDGSVNSISNTDSFVRISNSKELPLDSLDENDLIAVSVFTDIPILNDYHICAASKSKIMPNMQTIMCLKEKAQIFISMLNNFYELPEDEFWLIRDAYRKYQNNELDEASEILDKISQKLPDRLSLVPSICGILYNIYFAGLIGHWDNIEQHMGLISDLIKKDQSKIFDVPMELSNIGNIEFLIEKGFDFSEDVFNSKEFLSIAHYLDFIDLQNSPKYRITHDYPEQFFHLYEQACEYAHNIIKIQIGYLNVLYRNSINCFSVTKYTNYSTFFKKARLFDSLDLIKEHVILGQYYNNIIDRNIRNGIAHRSIGFSHDGQEIIIKKDTTEIRIPHDEMLKKLIDVCRVCITGFGIITDQKRIIADEPWK